MAATLKLNYKQIYNLAIQLSPSQQLELGRALILPFGDENEPLSPHTKEEVRTRAMKSMEDIKAGRVNDVNVLLDRVDKQCSWL